MKVTLERAALYRALTHVHRVVERRNTIPILSNILIRADGASLELKATDLDIEVIETCPAHISTKGGTTVPAQIFYDIIKKIPDGAQLDLTLMGDTNSLEIVSGRSRFSLQTLPISDFPDITTGDMSHGFSLTALELKTLIERTQFAISTEETRYYLNGIYLHATEGDHGPVFRGVATDGHRLAQYDMEQPKGAEGMPGIIIPRKTVAEIQRLIEDDEATLNIELSDSKIRFKIGATIVTSKLIDGTFPDYKRVIPVGNDKKLTVDKGAFRQAVDRVSTISSERGRAVKLSLMQDAVHFSVINPDSGSANEEIAAGYDNEPLEIGFNARYLLDIADQLSGSEAKLMIADPGSPTLVKDPADPAVLYVIMPMRV